MHSVARDGHPPERSTVTSGEPTVIPHHHPESVVYLGAHSWCSTLCGFGRTYNMMICIYHDGIMQRVCGQEKASGWLISVYQQALSITGHEEVANSNPCQAEMERTAQCWPASGLWSSVTCWQVCPACQCPVVLSMGTPWGPAGMSWAEAGAGRLHGR